MKLQNRYVIGNLVMFYELEMLPEYIQSCVQMMEGIENPENVTFHFCFNFQEYLEKIDWKEISIRTEDSILYQLSEDVRIIRLKNVFYKTLDPLFQFDCGIKLDFQTNDDPFYNIAAYRRTLNDQWCQKVDLVLWGETDSLWPKQTLEIIEGVSEQTPKPKFILNFAGRKNWDSSWSAITHPLFEDVAYQENDEWILNNEASEKSYMTIERMNEINSIELDKIEIQILEQPKADGSCLVISSELIKSGVNIPHALIHCGEDESFLRMAKLVMGNEFIQYNVKNILRVHNRRHPRKRNFILNEDNKQGFCDSRKGDWWKILEDSSKFNLENLRKNDKFIKTEEVIKQIQK